MPKTDSEVGGTYTGTFVFRTYLNPTELLHAGREYRSYLGQFAMLASETEINLAYALSRLNQLIIKAPPFWTSASQEPGGIAGNIGDLQIIKLVLDASDRAETMFKDKISKEREEILTKSIAKAEALLQKAAE
jgi:hypothetical protein